jgi:hypothetical protein
MLALRRVSIISRYIQPLSSCQYRYKSRKSTDDESKQTPTHLNEELLNFERKNSNTSRNIYRNKKQFTDQDRIEKNQSITRKHLDLIRELFFLTNSFILKVKH